jgi:hypothetical protein
LSLETTATVTTAGRANGTAIRTKIVPSLAPSSRAASIVSSGKVRKNCRSKNTANAFVPSQAGTISGPYVSTMPSDANSRKIGMIVICPGNIIVPSNPKNTHELPRARNRANAYAAGIDDANVPSTVNAATNAELPNARKKSNVRSASV